MMEYCYGPMFRESELQFLWHFLDSELIPVFFVVVVVHEIVEEFVVLIDAT